jgi:hypothetical protein
LTVFFSPQDDPGRRKIKLTKRPIRANPRTFP